MIPILMTPEQAYRDILAQIMVYGLKVKTRNYDTLSCHELPNYILDRFPIITIRKTAVMKAIREMEWFMSGDNKCPEELRDWWAGQLNPNGEYLYGYPHQFRVFGGVVSTGSTFFGFDQVLFTLQALRNNPYSRRNVQMAWNPAEMDVICEANENSQTPTCCHSTLIQFFVRDDTLFMTSYQRSADMLLGVPHNWVQSWALLLYYAHHSGLKVGRIRWIFGDAHIYTEPSHIRTADAILSDEGMPIPFSCDLVYAPKVSSDPVPKFLASDFHIVGNIPKPRVTHRPKLIA
jgi:thymidylate synthase